MRYCKHAQTGYPHASLQLFHQAVTLDVNPGGERQKKEGGRGVNWCNRAQRKTGGVLDWTEQRMPQTKNPPWQRPHHPPAYFPVGIQLGTHAGRWSGWVPSLNSPGALACQPSDLSQAGGGKPTTRIQNKHTLWTYWFFLFPRLFSNKKITRGKSLIAKPRDQFWGCFIQGPDGCKKKREQDNFFWPNLLKFCISEWHVCLFHAICDGTKGGLHSILPPLEKKTFPVWPAALRMPTDESKARCGADKEGLMPTSEKKPSNSHRWWFARHAGTQRETTKMAPLRYDNMAALCGDLGTSWGTAAQRRKKGNKKKKGVELGKCALTLVISSGLEKRMLSCVSQKVIAPEKNFTQQ